MCSLWFSQMFFGLISIFLFASGHYIWFTLTTIMTLLSTLGILFTGYEWIKKGWTKSND
ncbi:hypothetical protein [Rummeliibacillus stabekisii]|uniref:hypothetical protein n=1 Tax=Rummeliibacillus stabekisii TaxID=241244 RepID=UPI0037147AE7